MPGANKAPSLEVPAALDPTVIRCIVPPGAQPPLLLLCTPCHFSEDVDVLAKRVWMYLAALSGDRRTVPGPLRT